MNSDTKKVLNDPTASFWLKEAIKNSLVNRDILDAANDAKVLAQTLADEMNDDLGLPRQKLEFQAVNEHAALNTVMLAAQGVMVWQEAFDKGECNKREIVAARKELDAALEAVAKIRSGKAAV